MKEGPQLRSSSRPTTRSPGRARRGTSSPDRILDAATERFAASGYHATTTRDIAATLGMSSAALYAHYTSKEELLYVICLGGFQEMLAQVRQSARISDDPGEQMREIFRTFVLSQATHPTRSRVVNFEWGALDPVHLQQIARISREVADELRAVVQRGVDKGSFATDDVALTSLALTALGTDVSRWFRPGGTHTAEDVADHYAGLALRLVGAHPGHESAGPTAL
jgi:AcrR family transcriptional regulator